MKEPVIPSCTNSYFSNSGCSFLSWRMLAIGLRKRRFGYAVFEGTTFIDYGIRSYGKTPRCRILENRLTSLLRLYTPELVVLRTPAADHALRPEIETIKRELRQRKISCRATSGSHARKYFAVRGASSKHALSHVMAGRLPELRRVVLARRKPWQAEHYRAPIWDAMAAGIRYFGLENFPGKQRSRGAHLS